MKIEITVERDRVSVTQGFATVYFNGIKVQTFGDKIEIMKQGERYYGPVIGGWASTVPDIDFIRGTLTHDYEKIYNYHRAMDDALNRIESETEEKHSVYARDERGNEFVLVRNLTEGEAAAEAEKWNKATGRTAVVVTEKMKGE